MPNEAVLMKNGLYLPQATFPALVPVTGSNQVSGIAPFVQPVMIVEPYSTKQSAVGESQGGYPFGQPNVPVGLASRPADAWTVWNPFGRATTLGPTAAVLIQGICPAGWAIRVEELKISFDAPAGLTGTKAMYYVSISPAHNTHVTAAAIYAASDERHWYHNRFQVAPVVAGSPFYAHFRRGFNDTDDNSAESYRWVQAATYTRLPTPPLPELLMTEGGSLSVVFQPDAAANDATLITVEALLSWWRV